MEANLGRPARIRDVGRQLAQMARGVGTLLAVAVAVISMVNVAFLLTPSIVLSMLVTPDASVSLGVLVATNVVTVPIGVHLIRLPR